MFLPALPPPTISFPFVCLHCVRQGFDTSCAAATVVCVAAVFVGLTYRAEPSADLKC